MLSNNSCEYGLSCLARSECVQSSETKCNCSVVLRCKTRKEAGVKEQSEESGEPSQFLQIVFKRKPSNKVLHCSQAAFPWSLTKTSWNL